MNPSSVSRTIKIYARIKPTTLITSSQYDISSSEKTDEEVLSVAPRQFPDDGSNRNKPEHHSFRFTKIFDKSTTQDSVFSGVAKPVVDSALQGYNGTIFAYGQTGTGKTFTMTGSRADPSKRGIIPRTLSYVFQKFQEFQNTPTIRSAYVSYLEIYNEAGYDLLHSGEATGRLEDLVKVTLLEDAHQQMHLRNLSIHPIRSEEEALRLLYLGDHNRTVAETPFNEASTRSHCIFTIHLNSRDPLTSLVRRSKLHLVDLAGSERVSGSQGSGLSGQLLTETRHINLALHYLEQVIVALSDVNRVHIPYRNSIMTSVLRDSLGGNCMTSMIATLSMDNFNIMESLATCRFAQRVALVRNSATQNEELDPNLVIQQLRSEVKKLRETIASSPLIPLLENPDPLTKQQLQECRSAVEAFLRDPDPNSVLHVAPDLRQIQTCFHLLKMASEMQEKETHSCFDNNQNICRSSLASSRPQSSVSEPSTDMSPQELLQTISRRDMEIKVLSRMLRKEKSKRCCWCHQDSAEEKSIDSDLISELFSKPSSILSCHSDQTSICSAEFEDSMSVEKKQAFREFIQTHPSRDVLEELKNEIHKKQQELETLSSGQILNDSESTPEVCNRVTEYIDLERSATSPVGRSTSYFSSKIAKTQQELDEQVQVFRGIHHEALRDFENWWTKGRESTYTDSYSATTKHLMDIAEKNSSRYPNSSLLLQWILSAAAAQGFQFVTILLSELGERPRPEWSELAKGLTEY